MRSGGPAPALGPEPVALLGESAVQDLAVAVMEAQVDQLLAFGARTNLGHLSSVEPNPWGDRVVPRVCSRRPVPRRSRGNLGVYRSP